MAAADAEISRSSRSKLDPEQQKRYYHERYLQRKAEATQAAEQPETQPDGQPELKSWQAVVTCHICGKNFIGAKQRKTCDECKHQQALESNTRQRKKNGNRPLGTGHCECCGAAFEQRSIQQRYCDDCSRTVPRRKIGQHMICEGCGEVITRQFQRQRWCNACRESLQKDMPYKQPEPVVKGRYPRISTCRNCGKEIIQKVSNQRYCTECAGLVRNKASIKWVQKHAEEDWSQPDEKRQVKCSCIMCGREFYAQNRSARYCTAECLEAGKKLREAVKPKRRPKSNLWKLGALAQANGMSYGYLVALYEQTKRLPDKIKIFPPESLKAVLGGQTIEQLRAQRDGVMKDGEQEQNHA